MYLLAIQEQFRDSGRFGALINRDVTSLSPVGAAFLLLGVGCVLFGKRITALSAFVSIILLIPDGQKLAVFGFDLPISRILAILLLFRFGVELWGNNRAVSIGITFVFAALFMPVVGELVRGRTEFIARYLISGLEGAGALALGLACSRGSLDVRRFGFVFLAVSLSLLPFFAYEHAVGTNVFAVFGGVPAVAAVRDGQFRAQGPIDHPILAGCIFASILPCVLASSRVVPALRITGWLGVLASVFIILSTGSSTPLLALVVGLGAMSLFSVRRGIRRTAGILMVPAVILHLVHPRGLHYLVYTQIPALSGSTGYQRYALVQRAINHFSEWALAGTNSTYHWGYSMDDVTNGFVLAGTRGGFLCLLGLAGACVLGMAFALQASVRNRGSNGVLAFGVFCSLLACLASQLAVSFFGTAHFVLFLLVGLGLGLGRRSALACTQSIRPSGCESAAFVFDRATEQTALPN